MTELQRVDALLAAMEGDDLPRVIARWIDETRPVPTESGGYTVANVRKITLTGKVDGKLRQETFSGVGREDVQRLAAGKQIELIERSDNIGR